MIASVCSRRMLCDVSHAPASPTRRPRAPTRPTPPRFRPRPRPGRSPFAMAQPRVGSHDRRSGWRPGHRLARARRSAVGHRASRCANPHRRRRVRALRGDCRGKRVRSAVLSSGRRGRALAECHLSARRDGRHPHLAARRRCDVHRSGGEPSSVRRRLRSLQIASGARAASGRCGDSRIRACTRTATRAS